MPYTPAAGHRIIVHRTPGNHGRIGIMTGTVLDIITIGGVEHLHFKDDTGPRVYLATNEQMAEGGVVQTIERLHDRADLGARDTDPDD